MRESFQILFLSLHRSSSRSGALRLRTLHCDIEVSRLKWPILRYGFSNEDPDGKEDAC